MLLILIIIIVVLWIAFSPSKEVVIKYSHVDVKADLNCDCCGKKLKGETGYLIPFKNFYNAPDYRSYHCQKYGCKKTDKDWETDELCAGFEYFYDEPPIEALHNCKIVCSNCVEMFKKQLD